MKKLPLLFLAVAAASCSYAQKNPAAVKYAQYISVDDAKKHLTILASDAFEGRETGKPGADKAAKYIAGEFKKLGLQAPVKGSYFLDVPLTENAFKISNFTAGGQTFTNGKDFYSVTPAPAKTINANEIVFVGYGISDEKYDDLKGIDITGKVVLVINEGEPTKAGVSLLTGTATKSQWSISRGKRTQFLQSKNPALILSTSSLIAGNIQRFGSSIMAPRLTIKADQAAPVNTKPVIVSITADMANQLLKNTGKTYTQLKAEIDSTSAPKTQTIKTDINVSYATENKDVKAVDVLGFLPGSDPKLKNEVLVISAHYDHIGIEPEGQGKNGDRINNGADDDGSGTTGVLEIARAFTMAKKAGKGPKRSILFLGNVGEEKGLLGSEYYSDHPVFPLANTITDLNIDMIGRVDPAHKDNPNYCYLIGSDKLSTTLHKISEQANATYTNLTIDYKYNDPNDPERIYYRSDHYNFAKHNIPIIFYFNGVHEDYHGVDDEVEKIDFPMLVKRAQLVYYTAWELANRAERPVVDVKNDMPADK
ncbi:M28 family peptidase [Mucilaginibacter limnophilus]|uniref:M28 family peptidase n=1 Tax=Mucilaginibacter limnophilus TaxID=1932778 RepID=A0A437MWF4_9SPHI|nr:M28 family peptidase [Mucilaginibacter limnophilus]RVU02001.1 M28 family peptidase [Mucilaginibacter limnophilus]